MGDGQSTPVDGQTVVGQAPGEGEGEKGDKKDKKEKKDKKKERKIRRERLRVSQMRRAPQWISLQISSPQLTHLTLLQTSWAQSMPTRPTRLLRSSRTNRIQKTTSKQNHSLPRI